MGVGLLTRGGLLRGALVAAVGAVAGYLSARTSAAARAQPGATAANAYGPSKKSGRRRLLALDRVPPGGGVILPTISSCSRGPPTGRSTRSPRCARTRGAR